MKMVYLSLTQPVEPSSIMDEATLVDAVDSGKVWPRGLEMFEVEPKIHPGLVKMISLCCCFTLHHDQGNADENGGVSH